ncbi:diguanylate cyclase/phosphodiesterase (GGDEF & EAL domains) with PAS/PAC sensor(s) [Janthinobacterium sp. CG23_2]|nr:diguanylate cyclase/phosphodiesterase (GGDEF & EAL domains) with PAS/PAC sensor(s) [Janthinobacterium sp. CG23_2]CUU27583.1 diguanylate cyclase/phosphodiesterase (GGDEF & EAL domains) with PAS/PAC sensor(s) [Janthinobacterium sp. CG23_2]
MRRRLPFSLSVAAALTLGAGLAATALLALAVARLEDDKHALAFQQRATVRVAAIREGLDEAVEVVTVTNQLFATVYPVTRQQFHDFTQPLLQRYPFIQAFNYHRLVSGAEREAAEAALQQVVAGTRITEMGPQGRHLAPPRERYSVVDYLEPMQGNEAAFGLSVGMNARVMNTLDQATVSGRAAATGLLSLAQDKRPQGGFEVIMPVYRPGAPLGSPAQRRAALIGDTAAIIRARDLVDKILRGADLHADQGVHLAVYAAAGSDPAHLVYASAGLEAAEREHAALGSVRRWTTARHREHYSATLDVAGQPWTVVVSAAPRPFLHNHPGSAFTLASGLLFALLMTAFVQTLVQRSRRVQLLVDERTADLKLSNQRLTDDVLARRRTEAALQESELRFRQLVTMSSDWYWEQDAELRFIDITGGVGEKGGMAAGRLIGRTRWETVDGMQDSDWGKAHMAQLLAREAFTDLEYQTVDEHGDTRWFNINGEPVFDTGGVFRGYRGTGTDITARKLTEQRIQHIAQHDVLTGLPNRSLLQDRLSQAVVYSQRSERPAWILLIDLDRFKFVNDSMGHKAGDVVLMTVAARLRAALGDSDTVARLSGDEFVVILTEHDDQRLQADMVQRLMDAVAQPVPLGTKEFFVTCSIGVAVFPTDGTPADGLIEHADIAMYRAKKLGRNNYQFYTPAMNDEAQERVRIEGALRNALERNQFVLHYQPQVNLASGQIVGMEALIRWQHPELGVVAPNRFISVAEETGLIVPIGAWVMRTACAQNKAWQDAGLGMLRVAVNLSARQFGAPNLLADIRDVLASTGLSPALLEIELTESLFMSDVTLAVELLHSMKALGVNLSIDDFGTGYSSLSYLSRFPIDVLKIDRSFVSDITRDANDAAIVASIIALAHNLKLSVIAEGVETAEQLDYLRRHGCDEMQGYYFSRPLAAPAFEALLRERATLASVTSPVAAVQNAAAEV